jgi:L-threonylcarbamoyladenylate synthase
MPQWRSILVRHILHGGGIIAYPTEAVWGLGCLPFNESGARRILQLKQRSMSKGMILVAADISQLGVYLDGLPPGDVDRMQATWPGPVTWLVPDNGMAPHWLVGTNDTLAVRVSAHPTVSAICQAAESPLISTSANLSGMAPTRSSLRLRRLFSRSLDYIYPGDIGEQVRPTEIRHLRRNTIVRKG